jgi:hypothetical protein
MSGDDRTRTGGLSPDKRALCSTELRPRRRSRLEQAGSPSSKATRGSAGGIRTHDLELMRLARTASPLPRNEKVWPAGVEPAISGSRHRRGGQLPYSQKTSTLGGTRTRNFRIENPASSPFSTTRAYSGGRARTCGLAGNRGDLSESTTPERGGGSRTRTYERLVTVCADSSAPPFPLGHASANGRRGSRTPQTRRPNRFRNGIPRRWQSFQRNGRAGQAGPTSKRHRKRRLSGPGRRRTCTLRLRGGNSAC